MAELKKTLYGNVEIVDMGISDVISSSNPTSPTLTGEKVYSWKTPVFFSLIRFIWRMMTQIAIRKKIICLLATFLHKKPKPRPQEVKEIKEKENEVSSKIPVNTIVMPIRITFDNSIDFNDHFSKSKDLKKDLAVALDSSESSILPPPLLDFDSPFTAELSASITLNSLENEDKVFKPGILVYHAIHDKNLVTLEENLKENISSGTLLVFNEPSFLLPPPKPPDECLNFEPILVMKNVVLNKDFYQSKKTLPLNVEDVNSFAFVIWTFLPCFTYTKESPLIFSFRSENFVFDPGRYIKNTRKQSNGKNRTRARKSGTKPKAKHEKVNPSQTVKEGQTHGQQKVNHKETNSLNCLFSPQTFRNGYIKNHKKTVKSKQARTRERKSEQKPEAKARKSQILGQAPVNLGQQKSTTKVKTQNVPL
ncbi:hypothetical protein Tco_0697439 [Tanacetum coccineum]